MHHGVGEELAQLIAQEHPDSHCTHQAQLPPRPATYAPWPHWLHPALKSACAQREIHQLYSHQAAAATAAWQGAHLVISTGTSSGKSLCYHLPIVQSLLTEEHSCALYLSPTKALGSDQYLRVSQLLKEVAPAAVNPQSLVAATYDGDTPPSARRAIRDHARYLISNPDMVHASLLAHHQQWTRLLRNLKFIVIDESHAYRGVFGVHVSLVLRRLLRLCAYYGAFPTVICCSATTGDPAGHANMLTGLSLRSISEDGSPQGARTVVFWEPAPKPPAAAGLPATPSQRASQNALPWQEVPLPTALLDGTPPSDAPTVPTTRRAAVTEAGELMATCLAAGARVLSFVRSRRGAEQVALIAREALAGTGHAELGARVASYRAGYLAEDRRALERALDEGELLGLAATNALELGIDVGGLDVVLMAGFPGTVASFWQQAGRAGRRGQGSLVVLISRAEPMDTYLVHHPQAVLERNIERVALNPYNPYVLREHLLCAAWERPLQDAEIAAWHATELLAELAAAGYLRQRATGWCTVRNPQDPDFRPDELHRGINVRGSLGGTVSIVSADDGRLLGTVGAYDAMSQVHPGALYLHQGEGFRVLELDLDNLVALVEAQEPNFSTHARSTTDIEILAAPGPEEMQDLGGGVWLANVAVAVTEKVVGYQLRDARGTVVGDFPLDMPASTLHTRAVAYTVDPLSLAAMGITPSEIPGALHAAEHAAIGLLPLIATCDRWDIGGVSTALHPDTGLPTVFVYDGTPGGAGFADLGFQQFAAWMLATRDTIASCGCEAGCPSCVQSPKCGNGNEPLDKAAALRLLNALCALLGSS